jgi:hypothetical protein
VYQKTNGEPKFAVCLRREEVSAVLQEVDRAIRTDLRNRNYSSHPSFFDACASGQQSVYFKCVAVTTMVSTWVTGASVVSLAVAVVALNVAAAIAKNMPPRRMMLPALSLLIVFMMFAFVGMGGCDVVTLGIRPSCHNRPATSW